VFLPAVVVAAVPGCGTSLGDWLNNLLGRDKDSGNLYFLVYNFYTKAVRAEVTYRDRDGVDHTLAVTRDGVSPIPANTHGTLEIACSRVTTQQDATLTVTFTFPEDGGAQVVKTIQRSSLPCNYRARFGVFGPSDSMVGAFIEPPPTD